MASSLTKSLIVAAALFGGLLAGPAVNKVVVQIPAWQEVGVLPWKNFTRAADLRAGLILYSSIGLAALSLTVGAAIAFRFERASLRPGATAVYGAAAVAVIAVIVTVRLLAPEMLSLRQMADDAGEAMRIFASTARWWEVKALLHVLGFGLTLWAMVIVLPVEQRPTRALTRGLLVVATLIGGLLAGANIERAIVQNSAWHELGAVAWGAYSRHADLSTRGFVLYPVLGIGGALFSLAAVASFRRDAGTPRPAALPIYAGALLTIGGLLATTQAAPIMLGVAQLGDDQAGLQQALEGFVFWGDIRGVVQVLAFVANLWSLAAQLGGGEAPKMARRQTARAI
jgi:hypothetical protein